MSIWSCHNRWTSQGGGGVRRFKEVFSKPLWFGNGTRNLLGSRLWWDSWSVLVQAWVWNTWEMADHRDLRAPHSGLVWKCWAVWKAGHLRGWWRLLETSARIPIVHFGQQFGLDPYVSPKNLFSTEFRFSLNLTFRTQGSPSCREVKPCADLGWWCDKGNGSGLPNDQCVFY